MIDDQLAKIALQKYLQMGLDHAHVTRENLVDLVINHDKIAKNSRMKKENKNNENHSSLKNHKTYKNRDASLRVTIPRVGGGGANVLLNPQYSRKAMITKLALNEKPHYYQRPRHQLGV